MKSTALPRNLADWLDRQPTPKKRKRIPAMSAKRKKEAALYSKKRKAFLEKYPRCQVCGLFSLVHFPSEDVHHTKKRGKYYLDDSTWLAVCRGCHNRIHSNPKEARHLCLLA